MRAKTISLWSGRAMVRLRVGYFFAPVIGKTLARGGGKFPRLRPVAKRIERRAVDELVEWKKNRAKFSGNPVEPRTAQQKDQARVENFFPPDRFFAHRVAAVMEKMTVEIDADGAGLGGGAAKG